MEVTKEKKIAREVGPMLSADRLLAASGGLLDGLVSPGSSVAVLSQTLVSFDPVTRTVQMVSTMSPGQGVWMTMHHTDPQLKVRDGRGLLNDPDGMLRAAGSGCAIYYLISGGR